MKHLRVVQIGYGTVGGAVLEQIADHRAAWRDQLELDVSVVAFGGHGGAVRADMSGLNDAECRKWVQQRRSGVLSDVTPSDWEAVIHQAAAKGPAVVMDAAAGDSTATFDAIALQQGTGVVLSNKAPLSLPADDPRSKTLWQEATSTGRLRYEATVGAGLPVISTLQTLLDTGDDVLDITGMLSGTLGAIFTDVAAGSSFSSAVKTAKDAGFTEPDPRDDLSGLDVARKALILARTIGLQVDLEEMRFRSFVPDDLADVSIDEFLSGLERTNDEIAGLASDAKAEGSALKYMATVYREGELQVGLQPVPTSSVLGASTGPENVVSVRTRRYDDHPTVVSGPGAGAAVTAAGMVGDMLRLGMALQR